MILCLEFLHKIGLAVPLVRFLSARSGSRIWEFVHIGSLIAIALNAIALAIVLLATLNFASMLAKLGLIALNFFLIIVGIALTDIVIISDGYIVDKRIVPIPGGWVMWRVKGGRHSKR